MWCWRGCVKRDSSPRRRSRPRAPRASASRPIPVPTDPRGGYAKEFLRQQFRDEFGGDHPPDWEVRTTFVPELQDMAERAVADGLRRFNQPELQAALVAIDPKTGDMLALVGGRDFRQSQFNRAFRSRRQPGSAFKPFLFAAALEHGFSPVSVLDGLSTIQPQGPDEWAPRNASGETPDALTLRAALIESNNRAATSLQQRVGSRPVLRLASSAGMHDLPDVPSLSLGTGEVTPLDLTAAFSMFPNGGLAVRPRGMVRVVDADGDHGVRQSRAQRTRDFGGDRIPDGLDARGRHGPRHGIGGSRLGHSLSVWRQDRNDRRFQGRVVCRVFTPRSWSACGSDSINQRQSRARATASRFALPIWSDFMRRAVQRRPAEEFDVPAGLHGEQLCHVSYLRPVEECPVYIEYFKENDDVPSRLCPLHRGTVKQRVRRAFEGILSGLGRKIKGIFH